MLLQELFCKLKNFYYKNLSEHQILAPIYKFNQITKDELISACNVNIEFFEMRAKSTQNGLNANEKFFLMLTQDILRFLSSHKYDAIIIDDINLYNSSKTLFSEVSFQAYTSLMNKEAISEVTNAICNDNSYFHGDIIRFSEGSIKDLQKVEIIVYENAQSVREKLDKLFPPRLEGEPKVNTFRCVQTDGKPIKFELKYKGVKFIIKCLNQEIPLKDYFDFTVETILLHIGTGVINDPYYAIYDLEKRYLEPCNNIYDLGLNKFLTKADAYRWSCQTIDPYMITKFYKYSKYYKSRKKLKRFMRNAVIINHEKFNGQQLLDVFEYLIKGK